MTNAYRPDIDGLRGLAVAAIILFHIDPRLMPGGPASLSIFFVVSGYLISANIHGSRRRGTFSFAEFYARRAKRVLPAAMLVILTTLLVGTLILAPDDINRLATSSLWSLLMLANGYFYAYVDIGYFAKDAHELPLLHLWSLGVEEQFYAVWPALLVVLTYARNRWAIAVVVALAAASFGYGEWMLGKDPEFAYYMFPTRAGELLTGALAALIVACDVAFRAGRLAREATAGLGVLLMAHGLVWLDARAPFPGLNAVPVSIGTALVIVAGTHGKTTVSRILALPPWVGIGLISYPLYLWHWPIFAYVRYAENTMSPTAAVVATAVALLLAGLTYELVESRARWLQLRPRTVWLTYFVVPTSIIAVLALAARSGIGLGPAPNGAYFNESARINAYTKPAYAFAYNCQTKAVEPSNFSDPKCIVGANTPPRILLWGDSKAAQYVGFLGAIGKRYGFSFRNVTLGSCPAVLKNAALYTNPGPGNVCAAFSERVARAIDDYDIIIAGSAWQSYENRLAGFRDDVSDMVKLIRAKGKTVIVLGDVPKFPLYNRECTLRQLRLPMMDCQSRATLAATDDWPMNLFLKTLASFDDHVHYLDARDLICRSGVCSAYFDGRPIYYDDNHLSMSGSWLLGEKLVQQGGVPKFLQDAARSSG